MLKFRKPFNSKRLAFDVAIRCRELGLNEFDFVKLSGIHTRALKQMREGNEATFEVAKRIVIALKKLDSGVLPTRKL